MLISYVGLFLALSLLLGSAVSEPETPKLISCNYLIDDLTIVLKFSADVVYDGWLESFPCGSLFSFLGASTASCRWASHRQVDIVFLPSLAAAGAVVGDVIVQFGGLLRAKCPADYPAPAECPFFSNLPEDAIAVELVEPLLQSAVFFTDGSILRVTFDYAVTFIGWARNFPCGFVFDYPGALTSQCQWVNSKSIDVAFPSGSAYGAVLGDAFATFDGVLLPKCNEAYPACEFLAPLPAQWALVTVGAGSSPLVQLPALLKTTSCIPAVVDASQSYGSGGRVWASASVSVASTASSAADMQAYMQANAKLFIDSLSMEIPVEYAEGGFSYNVTLTLCNFLGFCSSSSMVMMVESTPSPLLTIQQGSFISVARDEALRLSLSYSLPYCDGSSLPSSQMGFNWTISTGGGILTGMKSETKDFTKFKLSPYKLESGVTYTVRATAWNKRETSQLSVVATQVYVTPAFVQAAVAGNPAKLMPFADALVLDATGSRDKAVAPGGVQPTLSYAWTCATTSPGVLSSCPSLAMAGTAASKLSIQYSGAAFGGEVYEITVVVKDPTKPNRNSSVTVEVTLLMPSAPAVLLTKSIATTKVNSFQPLKVTADIVLVSSATLQWSVNVSSASVGNILSFPPSQLLAPGTHRLVGVIDGSRLDRGVSYRFSLTAGSTLASVVVLVNRPPITGLFSVSPTSGSEITDVFTYSTSFWTDEDTPILFAFGFIASDGTELAVAAAAPVTSTKTVLPAGKEKAGYALPCVVRAYDSLGAYSMASVQVTVLPFQGADLTSALTASLDNAGTLDTLKKTIAISAAVLNTGNCHRAPDCAALNRAPCSNVAHTCGSCLAPFEGDAGAGNAVCINATALQHLEDQEELCYSDAGCPVWKECHPVTQTCVVSSKRCNWDCSGHGACLYTAAADPDTALDDCKSNDFNCVAECQCDEEYFGFGCNSTSDNLEESAGVRVVILDKLQESVALDDLSIDSSISLISMLRAASQDSFTLTQTSSDVTVSVGLTLAAVAADLGMTRDDMFGLLEALQSVLLAYTPSSTRRRLASSLGGGTLAGIVQVLETHGASVASQWLAVGNSRSDSILDQFTTSAEVFSDSQQAVAGTPGGSGSGSGSAFKEHSMSFLGEAKDMSVLSTVMLAKAYPIAAQLFSNPLRLTVKAANSSSVVRFVIQHNHEKIFEQFPSDVTFRTTCFEHSIKTAHFTCPDDFEITHQCNGTASVLLSRCRGRRMVSVCRAVSLLSTESAAADCAVESHTSTHTTCVCNVQSDGRRRLGDSGETEDTGYLEIAAMSEEAAGQFLGTVYEAENFNEGDIKGVVTIIILFAAMWMMGLLGSYYFSLRGAMAIDTKANMNQILKDARLNALAKNSRSVDSVKRYMNNYLDQIFPSVYGALPWHKRLVMEVKRHHRYVRIFAGDSSPKERFTTTIHLLTVQTMLMFMLAVFYDIQFPVDDGTCDNLDVNACEDVSSVFNTRLSKCEWLMEELYCNWRRPYIGIETVVIISVVVAVFTAPVNLVVDFLFNEVLLAPTADSLKLQAQDSAMTRAGRRVSAVARRASVSASAAVSAVKSSAQAIAGRQARGMGTKKAVDKNRMTITTTRLIPGETMSAQSLAVMSTSNVVDSFKQSRDTFRAHRDTVLVGNYGTPQNNSIALALANTGDLSVSSMALFSQFERELYAQRDLLKVVERSAFEAQWGIGPSGRLGEAAPRSLSCAKALPTDRAIQAEISFVQREAFDKYEKLKLANDSHVGLELLHLFVLDLLGRETPAAKIFVAKSGNDFRHAMVVAKWLKVVGWFIIMCLNIFFVGFALLRGVQRGKAWQEGYALACVVQFLVEIFMFETSECVWMNYLIPDAASTEIQAIKFQLRCTVDSLCSSTTNAHKHKYFLDAPEFLFVSTALAKKFPERLESMIIGSYHQHLPGELSKKWKSGQRGPNNSVCSRFIRNFSLFAITNGLMKLIGTIPPIFQRVTIHSAQPLLLAAFAIAIIFLIRNPIFTAIFALPILYKLGVAAHSYATTGVAFPRAEEDDASEGKRTPLSGHHHSIFSNSPAPADVESPAASSAPNPNPNPSTSRTAYAVAAAVGSKPHTPPTSVMPLSLANEMVRQGQGRGQGQGQGQSDPDGPLGAGATGNARSISVPSKLHKRASPSVAPAADDAYPPASIGDNTSQIIEGGKKKKKKKKKSADAKATATEKPKKKKGGKGKSDTIRHATAATATAVPVAAPPPPRTVGRSRIIAFSDSSDLSESSDEDMNDAKLAVV
jgi:hypothetical protein